MRDDLLTFVVKLDGVLSSSVHRGNKRLVGSGMELLVPTISDVIFKYTWFIKKYSRSIKKCDSLDSPAFEFNINGLHTKWNMSIRFWKGPQGRRLTNPVVICLNLLSCTIEESQQAKVRFQFGIYNAEIKNWEMCHVSRTVLHLQNTTEMLSLGYRDLSIMGRHMQLPDKDASIFVKIQLVPTEHHQHNLSQDLARVLSHTLSGNIMGDITVRGDDEQVFQAHTCLLSARSPVLAAMISRHLQNKENTEENCVILPGLNSEILQELLRYIYTDHVDNLDTTASSLMSVANNYNLPGLKMLCERTLIETITPDSVASLLLIADQFNSDLLKKAALAYCEDNVTSIKKTLAWKVMEVVNPDLFMEACETALCSSDSLPSDSDQDN